jgi:hypothetical protein
MKRSSLLEDPIFWLTFEKIVNLKGPIDSKDLIADLDITQSLLDRIIHFLGEVNLFIKSEYKEGSNWILPPENIPSIEFNFSLFEWMAFQTTFPNMDKDLDLPFFKIIRQKLAEIEVDYKKHDIFQTSEFLNLKEIRDNYLEDQKVSVEFIDKLEEYIERRLILEIEFDNEKTISIYPHRVVYLEGKLKLVAEDISDKCLITFDLNRIKNIVPIAVHSYAQNYALLEVNEFITSLREVNGSEVRLIIKIENHDGEINLSPSQHFLGDPYVTQNALGDTIWAATVEPGHELILWLSEISEYIDILDPQEIKEEVEEYNKSLLKKAG